MADHEPGGRLLGEIRAVVTDLDGTVVRSDGSISDATVEAAISLRRQGIPLLIATARKPPVRILAALRPYVELAVCCNGSSGYRPSDDQQLWRIELGADAIERVIKTVRRVIPDAAYGVRDDRRWVVDPGFRSANGRWPSSEYTIGSDQEMISMQANVMAVRHRELGAARVAELLREADITADVATLCPGGPNLLDLAPAGVDKGTGIRRALALVGIDPAYTLAFGDADNDLPLFAAVGQGVAMANGWPAVLRSADAVTATVDDDGFARYLDQLGMAPAI